MRQLFVLLLLFIVTANYGQALNSGTTPKVVQVKTNKASQPAFFVDGKFASGFLIDPQIIDSINIVNGEVQIGSLKYKGQVYIRTKTAVGPRLISLTTVKDKYTALKNKPVIFLVDGKIVKEDYDTYVVDESYVLQINVDTVNNPAENLDLGVIELLTKTEVNIKKSKEIRIRGGAVTRNQNQPPTAALRQVG